MACATAVQHMSQLGVLLHANGRWVCERPGFARTDAEHTPWLVLCTCARGVWRVVQCGRTLSLLGVEHMSCKKCSQRVGVR